MKIVLASASKRRREILEHLNICFEQQAADIEEHLVSDLSAEVNAMNLSHAKARAVHKILEDKEVLIISADTMVEIEGKILGKPSSPDEAREMMHLLSDKRHQVITGYTLLGPDFCYVDYEKTDVWFRKLSEEQIENYIATEEPYDKAGGYGIQDRGTLLVKRIEGDYFNVVGLPISRIYEVLYHHYNICLI